MKTKKLLYAGMAAFALSFQALAQAPAPAQTKGIVINNATIHVGNGEVIEGGSIAFDKGKIVYVGKDASAYQAFEQIDATGKHVYPGLILPNTSIGLEEIEAVRASVDTYEVGELNPNVRSIIAYNTDSDILPTMRINGILLAQPTPQGDFVAGTSSVVQLDAWNWEDAAYKTDNGLHINWPAKMMRPRWWMGETAPRPNEQYGEALLALEKMLKDAQAYMAAKPAEKNLMLEATKGVFDGSKTVFLNADRATEIVEACLFLKENGVKNIVLVGGADAWAITDFLKKENISVVLSDVHGLPQRADEPTDLPYRMPALLKKAGIKFCLGYTSFHSSRNLPFFAGTAAAYGLTKEEALQAVTKDAAEILGVADKTGTLTQGLDANIVVAAGDLLDMRGNAVTHAFIQGRQTALTGKQQELNEKYRTKYGHGK